MINIKTTKQRKKYQSLRRSVFDIVKLEINSSDKQQFYGS